MKKRYFKKALAFSLSAALAFSMPGAAGNMAAQAAKKSVELNTTFKTLKVGQKNYKLKLVNNTAGWKVKKVTTSDRDVCMVYGKKASSVLLKGKSKGRAVIKVFCKTAKRKTNNTKTLRCKVNVVQTQAPETPVTPPETPVVPTVPQSPNKQQDVSTQAELNAALNDKSVTDIRFKTDASGSFTIPSGTYGANLTVDAPNAEIENSGVFKSITINNIKENTWFEKTVGNRIHMKSPKGRVVVEPGASVQGISLTGAGANVVVEIKGSGKVQAITVSAKLKLTILGDKEALKSVTVNLPVTVQTAGTGSDIKIAYPSDVTVEADANVTVEADAKGSTLNVKSSAATVNVNSKTQITVTKPDGKQQQVSGQTTVRPSTGQTVNTPVSSGGNYGGGSSSGGSSNSGPSPSKPSASKSAACDLVKMTINDAEGTIGQADAEGNIPVTFTFPAGTDVTALKPVIQISAKAAAARKAADGTQVPVKADVESEEPVDFTNPVTYTITAENGKDKKNYIVTVNVQAPEQSSTCEITSMTLTVDETPCTGTIDEAAKTITFELPAGTASSAYSSLVPTALEHNGASVSPEATAAQNFTEQVKYAVTAQDGTKAEYTVIIKVKPFEFTKYEESTELTDANGWAAFGPEHGGPRYMGGFGTGLTYTTGYAADGNGYELTIGGTVNYIEQYTGFNGAYADEQSGYYVPINIGLNKENDMLVLMGHSAADSVYYKVYMKDGASASDEDAVKAAVQAALGLDEGAVVQLYDAENETLMHFASADDKKTFWVCNGGGADVENIIAANMKKYTASISSVQDKGSMTSIGTMSAEFYNDNLKEAISEAGKSEQEQQQAASETPTAVTDFYGEELGWECTTAKAAEQVWKVTGTLKKVKLDWYNVAGKKEGYYLPVMIEIPDYFKDAISKVKLMNGDVNKEITKEKLDTFSGKTYLMGIVFISADLSAAASSGGEEKTTSVELYVGNDNTKVLTYKIDYSALTAATE